MTWAIDCQLDGILTTSLSPSVFLNKDKTQVRIGDFGFARELDDREDAFSNVGVSVLL